MMANGVENRKRCPSCGSLHSLDERLCRRVERVSLCGYCKHGAEHIATYHKYLEYPRELRKLAGQEDLASFLLVLYYLAACLGHRSIHDFIESQLSILIENGTLTQAANTDIQARGITQSEDLSK